MKGHSFGRARQWLALLLIAWGFFTHAEIIQTGNTSSLGKSPFLNQHNMISNIQPSHQPNSMHVNELNQMISLDFQSIEVKKVLQMMADYAGINIVMSEAVHGKITLILKNVPWSEALSIVLMTAGLDKRRIGHIWLIDDATILQQKSRAKLQDNQVSEKLLPIRFLLIPIKYAKAADLAAIIKESATTLLSETGSVSIDVRTNSLLVRDKVKQLKEISILVKQLDIPIQQVEIEARIVHMNHDCARDLGTRLGITKTPQFGSSLSTIFQLEHGESVAPKDRLNFDLAAVPINALPVTAATMLNAFGNRLSLDLELSALESEGRAHIIASPRLITANQQQAVIESGEDIPYQESTLSGATAVSFKKAVLSLKVTPQITPDGKLMMDLVINHDTDSGRRVQGVPVITTKLIETKVLVSHGQTIVLGGILKQNNAKASNKVPLLGSIPLVKYLFGRQEAQTRQEELLIFITPRIMRHEVDMSIVKK